MAQGFTPGLQVTACTEVRRRRELPIPGKITVVPGQQVKASDPIGVVELAGDLRICRVADLLGLSAEEAIKALRVAKGQTVQRDELIAVHRGLFGWFTSEVQSPMA